MADGRRTNGGARPGAGRKPNIQKYTVHVTSFHDQAAADVDDRYAALKLLADGGFEEITETWEPAGLIFVGSGEWATLAFPHLPPDHLVCIKRTRSVAAPDRRANEYLINRIAGTPTQRIDLDADPDGAIEATGEALTEAARELAEWRRQMSAELSNMPSAPPTPPTSSTPTG